MNDHTKPSLDQRLGILPQRMPSEEEAGFVRKALAVLAELDPDKPFTKGEGNGKIHEISLGGNTKVICYGFARQPNGETEELEWIEYITVRFDVPGSFKTVRFDLPHKPALVVSYQEADGRLVSDVHTTLRRLGQSMAFPDVSTAQLMGSPIIERTEITFAHHPLTAALCELMFYQVHLCAQGQIGWSYYTINPMSRDGVEIYSDFIPPDDYFTRACNAIKANHANYMPGRLSDYFGTLRIELAPLNPVNIENLPEIDTFRAMHHIAYLTEIEEALFGKSETSPEEAPAQQQPANSPKENDMPRSLSLKQEAAQIALSRRSVGKPSWETQVQIKDLLKDLEGDENIIAAAHAVAKRLRNAMPEELLDTDSNDYDDELVDIIDDLETYAPAMCSDFSGTFNETLDALYDWADINRVWIY